MGTRPMRPAVGIVGEIEMMGEKEIGIRLHTPPRRKTSVRRWIQKNRTGFLFTILPK